MWRAIGGATTAARTVPPSGRPSTDPGPGKRSAGRSSATARRLRGIGLDDDLKAADRHCGGAPRAPRSNRPAPPSARIGARIPSRSFHSRCCSISPVPRSARSSATATRNRSPCSRAPSAATVSTKMSSGPPRRSCSTCFIPLVDPPGPQQDPRELEPARQRGGGPSRTPQWPPWAAPRGAGTFQSAASSPDSGPRTFPLATRSNSAIASSRRPSRSRHRACIHRTDSFVSSERHRPGEDHFPSGR